MNNLRVTYNVFGFMRQACLNGLLRIVQLVDLDKCFRLAEIAFTPLFPDLNNELGVDERRNVIAGLKVRC